MVLIDPIDLDPTTLTTSSPDASSSPSTNIVFEPSDAALDSLDRRIATTAPTYFSTLTLPTLIKDL